jgi:hypothetical protein
MRGRSQDSAQNLAAEDQVAFDPLTIEGTICHKWLCTPHLNCGLSSSSKSRQNHCSFEVADDTEASRAVSSENMTGSVREGIDHYLNGSPEVKVLFGNEVLTDQGCYSSASIFSK